MLSDSSTDALLVAARAICRRFGGKATSVLDVGSNATPTLEWHRENASRLISVDLVKPYRADGVESVVSDLLTYETSEKFDLVTCFQVLEHVSHPKPFARRLLKLGKVIVVSVPYKCPKGRCKEHPNDPVDEKKLREWFGRAPVYSHLSREVEFDRQQRLVHVYAHGKLNRKFNSPGMDASPPRSFTGRLKRLARRWQQRLLGKPPAGKKR